MPTSRVYPNQLPQLLQRNLSSSYMIFGDEPLQRFESVSAIVEVAKQRGFSEVERLYLDGTDDVQQLAEALQGMSLFASQRIIVLDVGNGKLGKEVGGIIEYYAAQPSPDLVVICHGQKLEKAQQNTKWYKALDKISVTISINVPSGDRLKSWLQQRARQAGVQLPPDAQQYLQDHHEGNLLALSQELEKLALLYGSAPIQVEQLHQALIDQSRFDVFQLTDKILQGQSAEVLHMLSQLRDEGVEPVIICWALSREISQLYTLLSHPHEQGKLFKQYRIWSSRQPLVKRALGNLTLQRLEQAMMLVAMLERKVKGSESSPENCWPLIQQCCALLMQPNENIEWLLTQETS